MASAKIISVGPGDLGLITDLYNEVYSPSQDDSFFRRRFQGRHNVIMMAAMLDEQPVGFVIGFELMPTTYFCWLIGVVPDARRLGIATQLMQAIQSFAVDRGYGILRFECQNQHRPMLHVAITEGYDLVGIRWDTDGADNVAIFEKDLR
jgi:GNAT superfamily N-acetyltransferase